MKAGLPEPIPPYVLDTEAAALATAGRYGDATLVAKKAIDQAMRLQQDDLANDIEYRKALYAQKTIYVREALQPPTEIESPESGSGSRP